MPRPPAQREEPPIPIGELARRSGFAASALRFYDERGLISSVRSSGGQRMYPRSQLRRLAFLRAAQNVGASLEEIGAALANLPGDRAPSAEDWARLSRQWRPRLDEQIAALEALRDGLDACIGCGCLSLERCPLSNPDDLASSSGPGARYLPLALRRSSPPR